MMKIDWSGNQVMIWREHTQGVTSELEYKNPTITATKTFRHLSHKTRW